MKVSILTKNYVKFIGITGGTIKYDGNKKERWVQMGLIPWITIQFKWGLKKK